MAEVLVVDDEILVCDLIAQALTPRGHQVSCVTSLEDAEAALERHRFDALICDVNLDSSLGTVLLDNRRLREAASVVLVMSGRAGLPVAMDSMHRGADDFLVKPFTMDHLLESLSAALSRRDHALAEAQRQLELERLVRERTSELTRTVAELHHAYDLTIEALGAALDLKDSETVQHCRNVCEISIAIAEHYGVTDETALRDLRYGALLHDLGKIGVPDAILRKPGPLTNEERVIVQTHPELGARLIAGIDFLRGANEVILYHHERYDGTGYPAGLAGEAIPVAARIFAVADAVDVLQRGRVYRPALTAAGVREEITRCAGTHFDPRAVKAFLSLETARTGALV